MKKNPEMNVIIVVIGRRLVNKIFLELPSPEPKVDVMIPMHEPLKVSKCKKCGKIIAEPKNR